MAQEMTAAPSSPYILSTSSTRDDAGATCTVTLVGTLEHADRTRLLTEGVFYVIEFLVASSAQSHGGSMVVDIRLADDIAPAALPGAYAFTEAVRGLVQSFTLEAPSETPAANVVISTVGQDAARSRTFDYLASSGGTFSRGATYDLRNR